MKRILSVLLAACLLTGMLAVNASAADTSGKCGDDITWVFDSHTLTISGNGPMYDYSEDDPAPWNAAGLSILNIVVKDGVSSIGEYAFAYCERLIEAQIAASVTRVGSKAFYTTNSSAGRVCFMGDAPIISDDVFLGRKPHAVYYFEWEASVLQNYGGQPIWYRGKIGLSSASKKLFALNEEIRSEDILFYASHSDKIAGISYTPRKMVIGTYDNSAYGQKTVEVSVDGYEFVHSYYVTDGQNHLDLIQVEFPPCVYYTGSVKIQKPVVTAGNLMLEQGTHYSLAYENHINVGSDAQVTVTGRGIYTGFQETYTYTILKQDISETVINVEDTAFIGMPVTTNISVTYNGIPLTAGTDYVTVYENNVNVGTGIVRIIGIGNFTGSVTRGFQIRTEGSTVTLPGVYNGTATGTLNDQVYYSEGILTPGKFTGQIDSTYNHVAYYELYQVDGEESVLITSKQTNYGRGSSTSFTYDFSSVYTSAVEAGGQVYMLAYSWVDSLNDVYSGICVLYIPAKVTDATSIVVEPVEEVGNFRRAYLSAYGSDGNVGDVEWTTSNSSVAVVKDGVVTMKAPGTVAITGSYSGVSDSVEVVVTAEDLANCDFLDFDTQNQKAYICYDHMLLTEGIDYVQSVSDAGGVTEVTIIGYGLFTGQLVRQYDTATGEALGHTHSFDNSCDGTCNGCDWTRPNDHAFAQQWTKDQTHHWHACTACGEKADYTEHTISQEDSEYCTVCGTLYIPGDLNKDFEVNNKDVEYLLWHTLFPESYPLEMSADFDGDGTVNNKDVEYLLWHTLFPESYPLT